MRQLSIAAALLAITCQASASPDDDIPDRYESGPLAAPVEVFYLPAGEVEAMCQVRAPGCMVFSKGNQFLDWEDRADADRCTLFVREDFPDMGYLIRHEIAHCRGWPPDHPAN